MMELAFYLGEGNPMARYLESWDLIERMNEARQMAASLDVLAQRAPSIRTRDIYLDLKRHWNALADEIAIRITDSSTAIGS
jgi:hypothetical protein